MFTTLKRNASRHIYKKIIASPARRADELRRAAQGPVVVAGLFGTASGIGASARVCADSLEARGVSLTRIDLSGYFGQTDLAVGALMESLPDTRFGVLLLHLNAPETFAALRALRLYRPRHWRVVGCWVWEFEQIPESWLEPVNFLSEIWAPTRFCADAFKQKVNLPIRIVPYRVSPPQLSGCPRRAFGLPDEALVVLSMADGRSSLTRKNLEGSISAFRQAFGDREDCILALKTRNLDEDAEGARILREKIADDPRIILINQSISEEARWLLLSACDIYLSLHRCEGFGLPVAEAMALGKAVVATGWSGSMDFMSKETAALIPFALTPVVDRSGVYDGLAGVRWADPNIREAAAALKRLGADLDLRERMGRAAKSRIEEVLTGDEYHTALAASTPIG